MKQLCYFILLLLTIQMFLCSNTGFFSMKKTNKIHHKQPSSDLGPDFPDAISYWEGWVQYYHSKLFDITRPTIFFQNNEYFSQRIPESYINKKDNFGSLMVPDKTSFYMVLTGSAIQVYSSREDSVKKQVDYLPYDYIDPLAEDAYMSGGVKDLGKFSKSGECVKISIKMESDKKATWIVCMRMETEKQKFMKALLKLKLKQQRLIGVFKTEDALKTEMSGNLGASSPSEENRKAGPVDSPKDGYWMLLQDWTTCTLKCGEGESYQQWQCIPPKLGGQPCKGEAIRIRKCNSQPCPAVQTIITQTKAAEPELKNAIIKIAPFSTRPQRYSPCLIKESDAFLAKYDPELKFETKFPIRIIMNNSTLSIYKDDTYQNVEYTYKLERTSLNILPNEFCCVELLDPMKKTKLCGYEKNCGSPGQNEWAKKWGSDFTLFKVECNVGRQESIITEEDQKQLESNNQKKMAQTQIDIVSDKENKVRQQVLTSQNEGLKKEVSKTQDLGLNAIEKELQLETLIRNEEKQREESEINVLKVKVDLEKRKADCLHKNIKEKDLDAEIVAEKRMVEQELKDVKKDIAKVVEVKRTKLKKLIKDMRSKSRIRKSALEAELTTLRQKMSQEIMQANKDGNSDKCKDGKTNRDKRESYCNTFFVDDFVKNSDCKSDESFCYMCCENEYGNMFIDKRENCFNMCDIPS